MPSQDLVNEFFLVEQKLATTINNYRAYNDMNIGANNEFSDKLINIVAKLGVIKNTVHHIQDDPLIGIISELKDFNERLREIIGIDYHTTLPNDKFTATIRIVRDLFAYLDFTWQVLFKPSNDDLFRSEIESLKIQLEADASRINQIKNKVEVELQTLQEKYNKDIPKYELVSQTLTFDKSSKANEEDAKTWRWIILIVTAILIITCFVFIRYSWFDYETVIKLYNGLNNNTLLYYDLFRNATLRLFILSIVIYILKFSIKNYNAAKHNAIINLHKANSFNAAIRIATSLPESDNIRNVILKDAGKEIFTQQKTGYLLKDTDKIDMSILDKILSLAKKE